MNYVDEVALMVWWLDDGGLISTGNRTGKLSTHGFDKADLPYLQALLKAKWGIDTTIQSNTINGSQYYYLQLSTQMLKNLLQTIMKHIPVGSMLYKAYLSYQDPLLQKDWISTMYDQIKVELHPELELLVGPKP